MSSLYTKTGDDGTTAYLGGRAVKDSLMIQVLGDLDELNAVIGTVVAEAAAQFNQITQPLQDVQAQLFGFGAAVANPSSSQKISTKPLVTRLEKQIDAWQAELPELRNFILPGGSALGAQVHLARTVTRRAERSLVQLITNMDSTPEATKTYWQNMQAIECYINRLSDWLFALARFVNFTLQIPEPIWKAS